MLDRILKISTLVLALAATPALAGDAPPPEARALIERQLDAFARDDAAGAYALAAPGIKALFPDADTFMTMVKTNYAAVYHHRSVEFGDVTRDGDTVEQILTLVDSDNQVWKALYKLQRQPDGSWAATGCLLMKSSQSNL